MSDIDTLVGSNFRESRYIWQVVRNVGEGLGAVTIFGGAALTSAQDVANWFENNAFLNIGDAAVVLTGLMDALEIWASNYVAWDETENFTTFTAFLEHSVRPAPIAGERPQGDFYTEGRQAALVHAINSVIDSLAIPTPEIAWVQRPTFVEDPSGQSTGNNIWFQIGANIDQGVHLSIADVGTHALSRIGLMGARADEIGAHSFSMLRTVTAQVGADAPQAGTDFFTAGDNGGVIRASGEDIQRFITALDEALAHVTGQRSLLGAMQNRLEFTMENLDIASENLSAAESRIRDADMALEMMRLTQSNVLQQAATAMLAQANQAPQSVLQLLG